MPCLYSWFVLCKWSFGSRFSSVIVSVLCVLLSCFAIIILLRSRPSVRDVLTITDNYQRITDTWPTATSLPDCYTKTITSKFYISCIILCMYCIVTSSAFCRMSNKDYEWMNEWAITTLTTQIQTQESHWETTVKMLTDRHKSCTVWNLTWLREKCVRNWINNRSWKTEKS